jgi:ATP-dependent exoDNAse (exonuclease V) beta subunit
MKNREDKDLPMTHNGYLKLYHLLRPKLHQTYDIIMLDEAQDTNEVIRDLVLSQKCGKVIVGDRHQGIYSFIGATDALDRVRATKTMRLTACFRFHDEIARVANALLALNTDETQRLVGMNAPYDYKSSRIEMGRSRNRSRKYFTQKKN